MVVATTPSISFEGEWDDEKVLFLLRAHLVTNTVFIVGTVLSFLLPFGVWLFFKFVPGIQIHTSHTTNYLAIFTWFLIVFGIAFQRFLFWYFNIYILTNRRIVDFDFFSVFSHKVAQATLEKIQDVTFEKRGIAQNFFDYGDIKIQTAAEVPNFVFEAIPDPEGCVKQILGLVSKTRGSGPEADYGKSFQPKPS